MLTIKDHATGLMYLCALPRKRPDLIAYKLQEIFGLIGYPKIFHTDNGKEFTAKSILKFLRHLNPNVLTVTGRPRRPRDQGSIENTNKFVKRVLGQVRIPTGLRCWEVLLQPSIPSMIEERTKCPRMKLYLDTDSIMHFHAVKVRPADAGL